ncbi:uncharacterized protein EMH_0074130 [Eimeria mitis]|uniref:Uncharacterized protein n=1 Tax=Eimeria mitis TaxID=44415 RepID=U6KBT7_9EIME|nr:uncharacterized protein EMH_0074130 [Eimeria mitis]CDJ35480.1 hypothetical protein EMH_0074130 [Eimeria mitis]
MGDMYASAVVVESPKCKCNGRNAVREHARVALVELSPTCRKDCVLMPGMDVDAHRCKVLAMRCEKAWELVSLQPWSCSLSAGAWCFSAVRRLCDGACHHKRHRVTGDAAQAQRETRCAGGAEPHLPKGVYTSFVKNMGDMYASAVVVG